MGGSVCAPELVRMLLCLFSALPELSRFRGHVHDSLLAHVVPDLA